MLGECSELKSNPALISALRNDFAGGLDGINGELAHSIGSQPEYLVIDSGIGEPAQHQRTVGMLGQASRRRDEGGGIQAQELLDQSADVSVCHRLVDEAVASQ